MPKEIEFRISFDDVDSNDYKTLNLLRKYKLFATFYPAPITFEKIDLIRDIFEAGHSIGGHTINHIPLTRCSLKEAEKEIFECKRELELLIQLPIKSFCYPRGYFNPAIKKIVKEAGFIEARTTKRMCIIKPEDKFELDTTFHLYPHTEEYGTKDLVKVALDLYNKAKREGNYYHIWAHSWEIEKLNLWKDFENIIKYISKDIYKSEDTNSEQSRW